MKFNMETITCSKCESTVEINYKSGIVVVDENGTSYYQFTCGNCGQVYRKETDPIIIL